MNPSTNVQLEVVFIPDVTPNGLLGSKHQLTSYPHPHLQAPKY